MIFKHKKTKTDILLNYIKKQNVNTRLLHKVYRNDFDIISFPDKDENGDIYNFSFILYKNKDEDIEIYIRKLMEDINYNSFFVLQSLNEFNSKYNASFFIDDDDILTIKSPILKNPDLIEMLNVMVSNLKIIGELYRRIKIIYF